MLRIIRKKVCRCSALIAQCLIETEQDNQLPYSLSIINRTPTGVKKLLKLAQCTVYSIYRLDNAFAFKSRGDGGTGGISAKFFFRISYIVVRCSDIEIVRSVFGYQSRMEYMICEIDFRL